MKLNINDTVKVKLTPIGWEIYRKHYTPFCTEGYIPPKQDSRGYVEFQLWDLMHVFGPNMYLGCKVPFETSIEI